MLPQLTRRSVVNAALAGTGSLALSSVLPAAVFGSDAAAPIRSNRLSDSVVVFSGAGGNVVALSSSDGLVLVDGGVAGRTPDLLQALSAEFPGRPVRTLLNTHWHWDHTGSNEALARTGATIIAHENTKLWLGAEIASAWEGKTYAPRPALALPERTFFYDTEQLNVGGDIVTYGFLPQAHTDGDIYVHLPAANVLIGGDVVTGGGYPILDYSTGGWIGGMIAALRVLIGKSDAQTRIVPGTGSLRSQSDLAAQLEMCRAVATSIGASYFKGQTWQEFAASKPTREFDPAWGDPEVFLRTAYTGAWGHINEMRRANF